MGEPRLPIALAELEARLHTPDDAVVADLDAIPGDLMLLGAGGKLGSSLARMARTAADRGRDRRVIAVSRFSDSWRADELRSARVEVISSDLSRPTDLAALPDVDNIIYLVGRKFGTQGDPWLTWAVNTYLPALVAERFAASRIVAFSTGNVYPMTAPASGGPDENTPPDPTGEYAQSCLGRERLLQHMSIEHDTPMSILRLNYAIDLRYGVLHDIAHTVWSGEPVDVTMGAVNVLWQGDVNSVTLRSLGHCASPPDILNVTGPETAAVRWLAHECGSRLGREVVITGTEAPNALLSNAARCCARFGYPSVPLSRMLDWTCEWVSSGGPSHGKPTKFGQRAGSF